ncbi:MAG TPA: hypothetical protein VFQ35_24140, partial [Polyangiaceae bacterium]|nr:hypothetical protein [Polyangiaceae bacterium]
MLPALLLELTLLGAPARPPEVAALRAFAAASPRPAPCRPAPLLDENGLWERTRGGVTERYCGLLAFGYARLRDAPERALELAREAEKLNPNEPEARVLAGRAALRLGDFAGAYAALSGSVTDPRRPLGDVAALREFGIVAQVSGHLNEAAASYRALIPRVAFTNDPVLVRLVTLEGASVLARSGPEGLSDAVLYLSEARRLTSAPGLDDLSTALLASCLDRAGNGEQAQVLARALEGGFSLERFASPRDRERVAQAALGGAVSAARSQFEFSERAPFLAEGELHAAIGYAALGRDARLARAHLQAYLSLGG